MVARELHLEPSLSGSLPKIQADGGMLEKAFDTLLRQAILSMHERDTLFVTSGIEQDNVLITIRYKAERLAEDDLEQFFFPRFTGKDEAVVYDLPLSKVIIHRHGGKIDVFRKGEDVVLKIELPVAPHAG
jgi:nitrogen-specific signal transduction histidine kinase